MSPALYALSLFIHVLATLVWVGGLIILVILVWVQVYDVVEEEKLLFRLLHQLHRRFYVIGNLALILLIITGVSQMTVDVHYDGLLNFDNDWSRIMLVKHVLVVVMVMVGLVLQYGISPAIERLHLRIHATQKLDADVWQQLRHRQVRLTQIMAILGIIIVGLSIMAATI